MKIEAQTRTIIALLLVGFVTLVAGCAAKKGVDRAEMTTNAMQTVNSDISQASMQIDAVKLSLDHLLRTGQMPSAQPQDVKIAYTTFSDNAEKMKETGRKLNKDIDTMSAEGNSYFQEWAKEGGTFTDPNIQKLSEERRVRLSSAFRGMESAAGSVRANLNAYVDDLEQIQTYLSNDLTAKGISAISPIAKAVERDGAKLKKSFGPVETSIMQARAELTPGGGAAAGGVSGTQQKPAEKQKKPAEQKKNEPAPGAGK